MLKIKKLCKIENGKNINVIFFSLLFSFLFGNIFGLNSKILLLQYPEVMFFIFPFFIELLNIRTYKLKRKKEMVFLYRTFISIRRGFLLGIFIEAFKLGS